MGFGKRKELGKRTQQERFKVKHTLQEMDEEMKVWCKQGQVKFNI